MKILLDTNIVLDYSLQRSEFVNNARKIFSMAFNHNIEAYISASTVTDIYYIVQKYKTKEEALKFLQNIILFIEIAAVDKSVVLQSLHSDFQDFEDAVQNFSATDAEVNAIVTRNKKDYEFSKLPVYTPEEFIALFEKSPQQ